MSFPEVSISYLGIIIAAIASNAIGFLWYSKSLFGNSWMKYSGAKPSGKGMGKLLLLNILASLITAYVLSFFSTLLTIEGFKDIIQFSFYIWIGFFASTFLIGQIIWQRKNIKLFLIDGGYWFVNLFVMSYIVSSI